MLSFSKISVSYIVLENQNNIGKNSEQLSYTACGRNNLNIFHCINLDKVLEKFAS